jgi:hypothetical protein
MHEHIHIYIYTYTYIHVHTFTVLSVFVTSLSTPKNGKIKFNGISILYGFEDTLSKSTPNNKNKS